MATVVLAATGTAGALTIESHPNDDVTHGISGSPPRLELNVDPGEVRVEKLIFRNLTGAPDVIEIETDDITSTDREFLKIAEQAKYGASTWITPEVNSVSSKHGDTIIMSITIRVPKDAEPGSHYAVVSGRIGPDGTEVKGASTAAFKASVALQVFLTVAGEQVVGGKIVRAEAPRLLQRKQGSYVTYRVRYRNTGNVTDEVGGSVRVRSVLGRTVKRLPLKQGIVLRGSEREYRAIWTDPPWIGRFSPKVTMVGKNGRKQTMELPAVWVIPPWYYLVGLLVALVVPLVAWWVRRRRYLQALLAEMEAEDDWGDDPAETL